MQKMSDRTKLKDLWSDVRSQEKDGDNWLLAERNHFSECVFFQFPITDEEVIT